MEFPEFLDIFMAEKLPMVKKTLLINSHGGMSK